LRIEVWDTGVGIPPDQHRNIFGEFYRLGETDRDQRAGLGLGLAIVDRLCRLLGHPITVTSTVSRGSRFSVPVPMVAARAEVFALRAPRDARPDIFSPAEMMWIPPAGGCGRKSVGNLTLPGIMKSR
jgi:Histidine kinase-, DNA gyrase B-, and HSP90-like ATPase